MYVPVCSYRKDDTEDKVDSGLFMDALPRSWIVKSGVTDKGGGGGGGESARGGGGAELQELSPAITDDPQNA